MEVIIKIKNNAPTSVKKSGMFLNGQKVTRTPVKVSFKDKKQWESEKNSAKFKAYMEEVKASDKAEVPSAETVADSMKPLDLPKGEAASNEVEG